MFCACVLLSPCFRFIDLEWCVFRIASLIKRCLTCEFSSGVVAVCPSTYSAAAPGHSEGGGEFCCILGCLFDPFERYFEALELRVFYVPWRLGSMQACILRTWLRDPMGQDYGSRLTCDTHSGVA